MLPGGSRKNLMVSINHMLAKDAKLEFELLAGKSWVESHFKIVDDLSTVALEDHTGVLFITYHRLKNKGRRRRGMDGAPAQSRQLSGTEVIKRYVGDVKAFSGVVGT